MIRTSSSQGSQISGGFSQAPQVWSYTFIKHLALLAAQPERPFVSQTQPKAGLHPAHPLGCSCFRGKSAQLLFCSAEHLFLPANLFWGLWTSPGKCQPIILLAAQNPDWAEGIKCVTLILVGPHVLPSSSQPYQGQCHQGALPTTMNIGQMGKPKWIWITFMNVMRLSKDWGLHIRILCNSDAGKSWSHFPWDLYVVTIKEKNSVKKTHCASEPSSSLPPALSLHWAHSGHITSANLLDFLTSKIECFGDCHFSWIFWLLLRLIPTVLFFNLQNTGKRKQNKAFVEPSQIIIPKGRGPNTDLGQHCNSGWWSKQVTHRQDKRNKQISFHQNEIPHFGSRLSLKL